MTKKFLDILINEIKNELVKKYNDFSGIYLFGSRVKGTHSNDSDLDIAITFSRSIDKKFKDEIRDLIYEYDLKYDLVIDTHIYNLQDILFPKTPFRYNVKNEGIFYGE
jgi:predicted nucleotidyltransferase